MLLILSRHAERSSASLAGLLPETEIKSTTRLVEGLCYARLSSSACSPLASWARVRGKRLVETRFCLGSHAGLRYYTAQRARSNQWFGERRGADEEASSVAGVRSGHGLCGPLPPARWGCGIAGRPTGRCPSCPRRPRMRPAGLPPRADKGGSQGGTRPRRPE